MNRKVDNIFFYLQRSARKKRNKYSPNGNISTIQCSNNNNNIIIIIINDNSGRNGSYFTRLTISGRQKFTASPRRLILKKFIIYNRWHVRQRKPCQYPDWMKSASHHSVTDEIITLDLPYIIDNKSGTMIH